MPNINIHPDNVQRLYPDILSTLDQSGECRAYAVGTTPYAHVWLTIEPYDDAPPGVVLIWGGKRGDEVGKSLMEAIRAVAPAEQSDGSDGSNGSNGSDDSDDPDGSDGSGGSDDSNGSDDPDGAAPGIYDE